MIEFDVIRKVSIEDVQARYARTGAVVFCTISLPVIQLRLAAPGYLSPNKVRTCNAAQSSSERPT